MKMSKKFIAKAVLTAGIAILFNCAAKTQNDALEQNQRFRKYEILDEILNKSSKLTSQGLKTVMIFDLDDTIFDAGSRTLAILKELSVDPKYENQFAGLKETLSQSKRNDMKYELSDNLDLLGIKDSNQREVATNYWDERFFKNCDLDVIHQKAKEFLLQAYSQGNQIVYLTGRDESRMRDCTVRSIRSNGLPLDASATLMLKPEKTIPDVVFKQTAFIEIERLGTVVAAFDNEPANVNAMADQFPNAQVVYIETRHSNKPDLPKENIPHITWD
jgi:predicted secreted acid phosphatase